MVAGRSWLKTGHLGKVTAVRGIVYKRRLAIGKVPAPVAPPATVNHGFFQGPAPLVPLRRTNFHYDWHWQWETGNGRAMKPGDLRDQLKGRGAQLAEPHERFTAHLAANDVDSGKPRPRLGRRWRSTPRPKNSPAKAVPPPTSAAPANTAPRGSCRSWREAAGLYQRRVCFRLRPPDPRRELR